MQEKKPVGPVAGQALEKQVMVIHACVVDNLDVRQKESAGPYFYRWLVLSKNKLHWTLCQNA